MSFAKTIAMLSFLSSLSTYGWIATLKVMQHPDGHIVRLAGDVHLEGFMQDKNFDQAIIQEEKCLLNIEKSLHDFIIKEDPKELIIVEKIAAGVTQIAQLFPEILAQGSIATLPLITRMNILAHPLIHDDRKIQAGTLYKTTLQAVLDIIAYDIRSKYPLLSLMSFAPGMQEVFRQELEKHQEMFKEDIVALMNKQNVYHDKFGSLIIDRGNQLLEKIAKVAELEHFFIYDYVDFGFLTFIAQHCHQTITLFVGIIHSHAIAQELENIGYQTIFEKGRYSEDNFRNNSIPGYRSKKDYQDFFAIS